MIGIASSVYLMTLSVFTLVLVAYSGIKMLLVTRKNYRFEYERRKTG